jgi:hypothetical protein
LTADGAYYLFYVPNTADVTMMQDKFFFSPVSGAQGEVKKQ